ncbi:hypothetical protein NLG97_g2397 [Lecanicillium saksenae]|uniref:Uncharacterized protein n=1 Tax=Lecanicillium saksenae TaxID=468837 RepID=A0ACC1R2S6_9HYPO|nr:hypothetical protein NLG97_g2397 [Lecanicillium saksenae]
MSSSGDGLFGPQLPGHFDFTLLFENVMFAIVPGGLVVLAVPFYLKLALRAKRAVRSGLLLWVKLAIGLAMLAIHITSLVLWQRAALFRVDFTLSAAIMSLVSSACILGILYIGHVYSLQPSGFLSVFLSITAIFDVAMMRSYFLREGLNTLGVLQVTVAALKFVLAAFEEVPKRSLFRSKYQRDTASRETVSGFWNRAVFAWINPLMLFGFRSDINIEDLPNTDNDFGAEMLYDHFLPNWTNADNKSKFVLAKALTATIYWKALQVIPPRLAFVSLMFSQPFLLYRVVDAVHVNASEAISDSLIGATALVFTGVAITRALYEHLSYRLLMCVRGVLIAAIYDKMHRLPTEELAKSAAVTLMSTDVSGIEGMFSLLYDIMASLVQLSLGLWSIWLYVGPACFLMLIPGICSFIGSRYLGRAMTKARGVWNKEIEGRVAATSNVLAQIKSIKSMGLSKVMLHHLQQKRVVEIEKSMQDRRLRVYYWALAALSFTLPPISVLAGAIFWTRVSNPLSVAEVFAVITMIYIAADPFMTLLTSYMQWSGGVASFQRIHAFLCLEEAKDARSEVKQPTSTAVSNTSEKYSEVQEAVSGPTPYAVQFDRVTVNSAVMGPILKEVTLVIPRGALAMVRGTINSGKSTFLRCITGEAQIDSGGVVVGTKSIAYCDQEPWILNRTLRENIIGMLEFVEAWYREVLACCGLDVDILAFTNGDLVLAGTGGCNLSGGQKQRVSLARAIYAQTEIMVVDDVLSSLDPDTARFVFSKLFGKEGLVRRWNCTVIITTNQLELLDDADVILQMHKGGLVEQQNRDLSNDALNSVSAHVRAGEKADSNRLEGENLSDVGESAGDASPKTSGAQTVIEPPSVKPPVTNAELENAREMRKTGDWSLYSYFFGPAGKIVIFWIAWIAVAATVEQMPTIFIKIWYSKDATNRYFFIVYCGLAAINVLLNSLSGVIFFFYLLPKSSAELHRRLAESALFATLRYLSQTDTGSLLCRFSQDMFATSQSIPVMLAHFVYMFFTVLVEIGIIAAGSPYTAPVVILLVVALYLIQLFYLRTSRQLRLLELEATEPLYTQFSETTAGMRHIRSYGWQPQFLAELYTKLNISQRPYYLLLCCQRWLHTVLDFTACAAAVLLVLASVKLKSTTSSSTVGLAMINVIGFNGTTSAMIRSWASLETGLGAVSRIRSFATNTPREKDELSGPDLAQDWPVHGRMEFNCVNASYEADDGTSQTALDNVTLTIQPGDKVGISGRTGSGKSSMMMTILRMTEFTGTISIDGQNTKSVPRELLRSRITTLTQEGLELKGSLRFNLYPFAGTCPEEDLITTTLQALGLLDHVNRHGGLDTSISDLCFSVSQKQLVFLCRGILHHKTMRTKFIIMDEATSAIDSDTDTALQELLDESFTGCTVLQIAHREHAFRDTNVRIRLDTGRVSSFQRRDNDGQWH